MAEKSESRISGIEAMDVDSDPLPQSVTPPGSVQSLSLQTTPDDTEPPGSEEGSSRGSSERGTPVKGRRGSRMSDPFQDNASTCSSTSSFSGTVRSSSNPKLPNRPGILWKKGERVEAMDFLDKWYPAKLVDIDEDEQMVMIHFDGWNSRYDEWLEMTSEKLRPRTRHSSRKEKPRHGVFKVGEQVYAKWTDCKMYPGKITAIPTEGAYEVLFYDGFKKIVQGINIKPMPSDVKNQKIEIIHVLPKDERRKSSEEVSGKRRSSSIYSRRSLDDTDGEKDKEKPDGKGKVKDLQSHRSLSSGERKRKEESKVKGQQRSASTEALTTANVTAFPVDFEDASEIEVQGEEASGAVSSGSGEKSSSKIFTGECMDIKTEDKDEEGVKFTLEVCAEQTNEVTEGALKPEVTGSSPVSPASTLSATTSPPLTPKQPPVFKAESNIPTTVLPSLMEKSADRATPIGRSYKKAKKETISPSASESSLTSQTDYTDIKKRSKSLEKKETFFGQKDSVASRKRSRSTTERGKGVGNYILVPETVPPPKAFVVEQEHNHYKCTFEGCNKGFRKESLLDYHVKYYHSNDGKPIQIPPPRKRRKTSSICSTDSDASIFAKQRSRSLSGSLGKQRHVSADSISSMIEMPTTSADPQEPSASGIDEEVESTRQRTISQTTVLTEEVMETDAEDTLSKDEVVNCICGYYEENGLMIQCDVCLCWQHAACFDITEATLPKKYVCYICENPPGVRDSFKYIHEQDWLRNGQMAHFKFLPNQEVDESRCRTVQATHGLVADVLNIAAVLNSLKQEYKIARGKDKTNPELRNWIQNLDLVEPEEEDEDEDETESVANDEESRSQLEGESRSQQPEGESRSQQPEDESRSQQPEDESRSQLPEEKLSLQQEENRPQQPRDDTLTQPDEGISQQIEGSWSQHQQEESRSQYQTESAPQKSETEVKDTSNKNAKETKPFVAVPSSDSSEVYQDKSLKTFKDSNGEASTAAPEASDVLASKTKDSEEKAKAEEQEVNGKDENMIREDDNSDTLSADSIRYDESETGGEDSQGPYHIIGPSGDAQTLQGNKSGAENVSVVMENPFKDCERNLLEHIHRIQNEMDSRLDLVEEQVSALEAADSAHFPSTSNQPADILADIPQLKRSLYLLQSDLEKVKLISTYQR